MADDWMPKTGAAQMGKNPLSFDPQATAGGLDWTPSTGGARDAGKESRRIGTPVDLLKGIGGGIFSTIVHGGDIIRRSTGQERIINYPAIQDLMGENDDNSLMGAMGHAGEQVAENFIPVPGTGKIKAMMAGKKLIPRIMLGGAKDALQAGSWATVQSGADPWAVGGAVALGGTVGAVTGGVSHAYDKMASLTQDVDPTRIDATKFARGNQFGVTVDVDPATRTGSSMVRNTKKFLSSGINAPDAEQFGQNQNQQYDQLGKAIVRRVGGGNPPLDPDQVGESGYRALDSKQQGYSAEADRQFGAIRAQARMMPAQQLPVTRWEMQPTGQVDQMGRPIMAPRQVQVQKYFHIPIDRASLQQALRPLMQHLGTLSQAEQDASPALPIIKQIVNGDSVVEATDALHDLSAMYSRFKLERGQVARDVNQFLGSKAMQQYRQTVDTGLSQANPGLLTAANEGRAATGKKWGTIRLMNKLGGRFDPESPYAPSGFEPMKMYNNFTRNGDAMVGALTQFKAQAPGEVPKVAASVLQGLLNVADKNGATGAFSSADAALNAWNRLGPRTKELLYGPLMSDLDNFFRLGKYLAENPNPSNTGMHVWMAARLMNLFTNPGILAKDTALEFAMGKYIFSNRGPLPYWNQALPGSVNPAAATIGGIWTRLTGHRPQDYLQNQQQPQQPQQPRQ